MRRRALGFAFTLIVTVLTSLPALSTPIKMPNPVPGLDDSEETRIAIIAGMARRNWQVATERPGSILARLALRRHVALTRIDYSTGKVTFAYAGSTNMECEAVWPPQSPPWCSSIHRRYNEWLRNLHDDIAKEIAKIRD